MLKKMKATIRKYFAEGGILIIRYTEFEFDYNTDQDLLSTLSKDKLSEAFERIKSCIATYPSKQIPIIQEGFLF